MKTYQLNKKRSLESSATKTSPSKTNLKSDEESADENCSAISEDTLNSKLKRQSIDDQRKSHKLKFKYTGHFKEDHGRAIYGISFNTFIKDRDLFATVGKNRVTIYECLKLTEDMKEKKTKEPNIKLLRAYCDPDEEELFYTCCWNYNSKRQFLVICGGLRAVIRIINIDTIETEGNLIGHTHAINEIKVHPKNLDLILSASKDHTVRLWDIKRYTCLVIFGGVEGHRDEIITADFDFEGRFIVSGGMDHFVRLWSLTDTEVQKRINNSCKDVYKQHHPYYSNRDLHVNYVDSVKAYGDFIISKGCDETLAIWKPGHLDDDITKPDEKICTVYAKIHTPNSDVWFLKFSMDVANKLLAFGANFGKTYVYNLDVDDPKKIRPLTLFHEKCKYCVRGTSFSNDSKTLIAVTEDGIIWRYDC